MKVFVIGSGGREHALVWSWLVLSGYPGDYSFGKTIEAVSKIRFYEMQYRKEFSAAR
jgi:phosphoribosylamine-glycine ligase